MIHRRPRDIPGLPVLNRVQSSLRIRQLANGLLGLLIVVSIAMMFVPWQQTARGSGRVLAYDPQERQQFVTSPMEGIVMRVSEGIREGVRVKEGETILEIEPNAPDLKRQLELSLGDLKAKLATAEEKINLYGMNVADFEAAKVAIVSAYDQLIAGAKTKIESKRQLLGKYQSKEHQSRINLDRQAQMLSRLVISEQDYEVYRRDWEMSLAELESAQLDIVAAKYEWEAKISERTQKEREAQAKIDYARGMQQDSIGLAATIRKDVRDLEIKISEFGRFVVAAPRDGTLFRLSANERGQAVKKGDQLFTIVPDMTEPVVELWLDGNDIPLVQPGDHVRLQFEGWPAVQFAGWPSVAVGTFGGEILAIDATDDGSGRFRVLVQPHSPEEWPTTTYLRQGAKANGWVILNRVPLGYELWRLLNGFPPSVTDPDGKSSDDKTKKVKLPK